MNSPQRASKLPKTREGKGSGIFSPVLWKAAVDQALSGGAGRTPANEFDKLVQEQQERLTKAQPFAAQRGLLKDEVTGLFGAINKRDYMAGMKDLLMELYDCPDYFDKDTKTAPMANAQHL